MKRAVIIINGDLANFDKLKLLKNDFVICADGAVEKIIKKEIMPSVVIGDFDSTSKKTQNFLKDKNIECITYAKEKDKTDSELAVEYAIDKKYKTIVICGLLGSRIDHLLANIFMLQKYILDSVNFTFVEHNSIVYTVRKKIIITGQKKDLISLIPLTKKAEGISTSGLYYTLENETLEYSSTKGVSNFMTEYKVLVTIMKGIIVIVHTSI